MKCKNCNVLTNNPKFCSRRCSAIYNNKKYPKRSPEKICKGCSGKTTTGRTYCDSCFKKTLIALDKTTKANYTNRRSYQVHSQIRAWARKSFSGDRKCAVCGYDKSVHICHIIAIKNFPDDTTISVINDPSNLVALCPNHHWELDNGFITVEL